MRDEGCQSYNHVSYASVVAAFRDLQPGRYASFNWAIHEHASLTIAILDSPRDRDPHIPFAALIVPAGKEEEWIFSLQSGHWQLLSSAATSRLVLVMRLCKEEEQDDETLKAELTPLLAALSPIPFHSSSPPFISYHDNVINRVIVEEAYSSLSGNMLVEDVELLEEGSLRRRLRFQRMPNLIQTEIAISMVNQKVKLDHTNLVHKYLPPIVAGLVLASPRLQACLDSGTRPKVLSIGVGGGALPIFLNQRLGFYVEAVDLDKTVLELACNHFGLLENEHLRVRIGDGRQVVFDIATQAIKTQKVATDVAQKWQELIACFQNSWSCGSSNSGNDFQSRNFDPRMDVIVVDVDAGDACLSISSPPMEFLEKQFLLACLIALQEGGMLILNILTCGSRPYNYVISTLKDFFAGLYEIEVSDGENHVVFAFLRDISMIDLNSQFAVTLKNLIGKDLLYEIIEIK